MRSGTTRASSHVSVCKAAHSQPGQQPVRSWDFTVYSNKCVSMTPAVPLGWQAWSPSGWHCQEQGCCRLLHGDIDPVSSGEEQILREKWEITSQRCGVTSGATQSSDTKALLVWQTFFFMQLPRSLSCDFFSSCAGGRCLWVDFELEGLAALVQNPCCKQG